MGKNIVKIVITGGPCAGKTSGMNEVLDVYTKKGYTVLVIPETATELILHGIAPWTLESSLDYQLCQMKLQIEKEKIYDEAANKIINSDNILIVCDRGLMDNKAYMSDDDFNKALKILNYTKDDFINRYDAVFHLKTVANGKEECYTLSNNKARTETVKQAIEIDNKIIEAWKLHPDFKIIDNADKFEDKIKKLIDEISAIIS